MKVKICGITNLKDAYDAARAGVDALGFVFYEKSPRYIDPILAKYIVMQMPPFIQSVGLFVNIDAKSVNEICKLADIDLAQIHFDATNKFYDDLKSKHLKVIRAKKKEDILSLSDNEYYLVDAFVQEFGGVGKRVNLEWFDGVDCSRIILAGGLDENNLKDVLKYNFYGVDVSSSVEISKRRKDKIKMIDFIKTVQNG